MYQTWAERRVDKPLNFTLEFTQFSLIFRFIRTTASTSFPSSTFTLPSLHLAIHFLPSPLASPVYLLPQFTYFPSPLTSPVHLLPQSTCFPSPLASPVHLLPQSTYFPSPLAFPVDLLPQSTYFPSPLTSLLSQKTQEAFP